MGACKRRVAGPREYGVGLCQSGRDRRRALDENSTGMAVKLRVIAAACHVRQLRHADLSFAGLRYGLLLLCHVTMCVM